MQRRSGRVSGAEPKPPTLTVAAPNNKVTGGALAGALCLVITWAIRSLTDVTVPAEVAVALTTILTFIVGYFVVDAVPPPVQVEPGDPGKKTLGNMTVDELRDLLNRDAEVRG